MCFGTSYLISLNFNSKKRYISGLKKSCFPYPCAAFFSLGFFLSSFSSARVGREQNLPPFWEEDPTAPTVVIPQPSFFFPSGLSSSSVELLSARCPGPGRARLQLEPTLCPAFISLLPAAKRLPLRAPMASSPGMPLPQPPLHGWHPGARRPAKAPSLRVPPASWISLLGSVCRALN
jgi:hypothetical protein